MDLFQFYVAKSFEVRFLEEFCEIFDRERQFLY